MRSGQSKIFSALAIILFFSGSFSLIYQIAWVRFLTLLLGSTTMGITTVVATFMSGLAIGSWAASRYLINKEKPLKVYALLEFIIAAGAFISPVLFRLAFSEIPDILQRFGQADAGIFFLRIAFSAVIMTIPTICMGAALPVLGKYLQQHSNLAERRITIIYGLNTVGAAAGCIASGYFLLREIGLINTIYVTAFTNALLAVAILLIPDTSDKKKNIGHYSKNKLKTVKADLSGYPLLSPGSRKVILLISAAAGFIGLSSELVWTRLIVLSVGGSIYAYSTILAVYLFFYGIGAASGGYSLKYIAERYGGKAFDVSQRIFLYLLLLIPAATTVAIAVANYMPDYFIRNFSAENSSNLYGLFLSQLFPAVMMMSAATLLSGAFFSYGLFLMKQCTDDPAENTSLFYTWNTVGGIAGTIVAAFLLIPYFGLDNTLRITGTLLIAAALLYASFMKIKKLLSIHLSIIVCIILVWFIIPRIDRVALTAGAGIYTAAYSAEPLILKQRIGRFLEKGIDQLFYKDGFTATVTVTHPKNSNEYGICTNGKSDGSAYADMPTQKLGGHFTALFHPAPETACVIGFGTGTTVGSLALHPGINVDAVEIEPAIIEASKLLNDFNNDPLSRENVSLKLTDGRLHLQRNTGKYDIIFSEPSNPWIAGVSDLFTTDFYELAEEAMTENGVIGQWVQVYNLDPEALRLVFRTFQEVFPQTYTVILNPGYDLMLIGCKGPYRPALEDVKNRISVPDIAKDIAAEPVNVRSAYELFSRLVFGPEQTRNFAGKGSVNTDILPVLSYMAPLSLFNDQANILNMRNITKYWDSNISILGWNNNEDDIRMLKSTQENYLRENFFPGR